MTPTIGRNSVRDSEKLRPALDVANVPALLMVLYQFTGNDAWLQAPYLPTRTRGLDPHDTGGLAEDVQREVRAAAYDALLAWAKGRRARSQRASGRPVGAYDEHLHGGAS